jgi:alpha-L-fucosidase 2
MLMQSHDGAIHILPALPDVWSTGKVSGLRARGGFLIEEIAWENGKIKALKVKSTLGGNLRIRTENPLVLDGKGNLQTAKGENPNPFFKTPVIPAPIISENAKLNPPAVKTTVEYDLATEPGKEYVFIP